MKKIGIIIALVAGIFSLAGCEDDKAVKENKLPDEARSFILQFFPGQEILFAERDRDDGRLSYSVTLSDGTEIDFFESGEWESVESKFSAVPDGIVPSEILNDIRQRVLSAKIRKIEKELGGYEVTVSRKTYLYDRDGIFLREYFED